MNNIPRFRAWDYERKIYGEVVEIAYSTGDADERFLDEAEIPHAARVTLYNPENKKECGFWGIWIERCDIEEYTGMNDKNKKEICIGDIIKQTVVLNGEEIKTPVRWIDCGIIANGLLGTRESELSEIVGNIHYIENGLILPDGRYNF